MISNIRLSPRETQALELLAADFTTISIAKLWGVSKGYVNNIKYSARKKLNTQSTLSAVAKATKLGLLDIKITDE